VLRIWAAGHLNKSREVTSSGPYRWFAHPLYVGSSIMGAGLAIACASVFVAVLIAFYLCVTITAAVRTEEAFLRKTFGEGYDAYRNGHVSGRRFSFAQAVRNREHRTLLGLVFAMLLLLLKLPLR
jgi:protein-S-isoprenylcysteine O-methyltransferase Ste14